MQESTENNIKALVSDKMKTLNTPVGRVMIGSKIVKVAELSVDELRDVIESKGFAHSEEIAMVLNAFASPFKDHKTKLKLQGAQALFKDPKFIAKLQKSGANIPDTFITIGLNQISEHFDSLFDIF